MFNFLVLLLALGVCLGINFFAKRPMVNPGRAAAIIVTILMLVEMAAVLLMPSGGRAYQLGRALGSAFLPLIIALYISQKFKERHTFRASAPDIATPEEPR